MIIRNKLQFIDCYTPNSGAISCIVLFTCPYPWPWRPCQKFPRPGWTRFYLQSRRTQINKELRRRLFVKLWEGKKAAARGPPSNSRDSTLEGTTFLFACLAGAQDNSKLKSLSLSTRFARDLVLHWESFKNKLIQMSVRNRVREKQKIAERLVWKVKIILIHEQRCWRESPWRYIRCPSSSSWVGVDCVTSTAAAPRHPPHTPPASRAAAHPSSQRSAPARDRHGGQGKRTHFDPTMTSEAKSAQQGGGIRAVFEYRVFDIWRNKQKNIHCRYIGGERPSWLIDWLVGVFERCNVLRHGS